MGRYKDYREPRRRGYDDDTFNDRAPEGRPNFPTPSAPQASEPVDAVVKWFNAEKGFGFVALASSGDAFIHIRQLERAGHSSVPEGARIKVRIGQGQKGPEAAAPNPSLPPNHKERESNFFGANGTAKGDKQNSRCGFAQRICLSVDMQQSGIGPRFIELLFSIPLLATFLVTTMPN